MFVSMKKGRMKKYAGQKYVSTKHVRYKVRLDKSTHGVVVRIDKTGTSNVRTFKDAGKKDVRPKYDSL